MKKIIVLLLLFVTVKFSAQTSAAYLSDTAQPWLQQSNITAMFAVYGADWTHYDYATVNAATLFDPNRNFIWIDGSELDTSLMLTFLSANTTVMQNWVNAGGVLLISTATNEFTSSYGVGFGITSSWALKSTVYPSNTAHPFFANSNYTPIVAPQYTGSDVAHNFFTGPGLDPVLVSSTGDVILAEKTYGAGLVIYSGLTTPWFDQTAWQPHTQILNVLHRMIGPRNEPIVTVIGNISIPCSGSSGSVTFNMSDNLTTPGNLIVTAASSNQALVPNSSLVISGTGGAQTLAISTLAGQTGSATISVNVTDEDGNTTTRTFLVTVQDTIAPTVITQNITAVLDASGTITLTPADINNGSFDNCGIASMALTTATLNYQNVGANTIGLIVTDINGNVSIGTAIVTIPITCPSTITVNNTTGSCGAVVNYNSPGAKRVLLLAADGATDINDVRQKIAATGYFNGVDTFNAIGSIPTLAFLKQYEAVLLWTDSHSFNDVALGNVLAAYIENGGGVVDATFDNASIPILGAYNTAAYRVLNPGGQVQNAVRTLGTVAMPGHPIMNGVTSFNGGAGSYHSPSASITPGSYVIARYDNNDMLIIAKENVGALGARRVSLNFLPVSADAISDSWVTTTSGALIMANALKWVGNASTVVQIAGLPSGSFFPVGTTTNTFESTDAFGNVEVCSFDVVVNDTEAPVVLTQNITVQLNAAGNATITALQVENGSTDNCAIDTHTLDVSAFTCANLGANPVVLTVTDIHGNSAANVATVTVQDITAPVVVTQDITIQLDATGNATITPAQIDNGSSDACGIATSVLDITTFNCTNIGVPTMVTLTVTDASGNTANSTAMVTVEDTIAPTVLTQDITVALDAVGSIVIIPSQIDNGSSDACGIATYTLDIDTFNCSNIGTPTTVTLTVTDMYGNIETGTAIVTIEDLTPPAVVTQDITVQLDAAGNATITPSQIENGSTDACGIATSVLDITTFTCTNVGPNTVTLTVTDVNGNSSTGTATVTIEDMVAPVVVTQDITVQLDATGTVTITPAQIDNGSSDACGVATLALDVTTFDCTDLGANTVRLQVIDVNGNSTFGNAIVTVEDVTNPIAVAQDITVQLDATGNVSITPAQIDNGSSDACGTVTLALDVTAFTCANVGVNTVVLTATDASGNATTATATVTVQDTVAPSVITQDITVQLDAAGNATITTAQIDNGSYDACGIASMLLDVMSFTCANIGVANMVTLTVTDINGNVSNGTAVVTVMDITAPVVVTQNITVQLDATGNATITAAQIDNGSSDACGIAAMALDVTSFDCTNIGAGNTVTLTVTDVNGNSATGTAIVSLQDSTAPVVLIQDITIQLNAAGNATITAAQIDNGSSDTCGAVALALDTTTFDCTNVGTNTVTLTVTDANGNTATGTAIVTVQDTTAPVVITQNITLPLDAAGNVVVTPAQINNGSSDACGIATMALDVTAFDCSDIGVANTVVLTVTDVNGNMSTGTATVTVQDVTPPVVVTQDITIQLDTTGNTMITAADIDNGSYDNCGIASMSIDVTSFDCSNIGVPNYVVLTVTDIHGNSATATGSAIVTIIIEDVTPPVIITQDLTVQLDATGHASITADEIENGSYDACGIQGYSLDVTSFDCNDLGANTVNLSVTDNSNNTGFAPATVTVQDVTAPVVVTQNITVQLDATGNVTITPAQINNGSTDACGIAAFALDVTTFNCSNIGITNTVTLTATDASGNSATGTATVTVQDTTPPVLVVQNIQAQLDATGNVTITPADIDNGSYDNCAIANMTINRSTFTCFDYGPNQVIITATDTSGLTSSATVIVSVIDTLPPAVVTQNLTVELGPIGTALIFSPMVDNGSTDNCGISALILDNGAFDCDDIGVNTVILTVEDIHGNSASAPAQITVVDNLPPTVLTFPVIVQLDAAGTASVTAAQVNHGSTDNCGIATMTLDVTTFDCSNIGTNTVNLTVTDVNGNSATATGVVVVEEHMAPTVITQPFTVLLDIDGNGTITTADVDNGSFDNCAISSMHLDKTNFTCEDLGVNEVILTVHDTAANSAFKPAQITVVDNVAPIAIAQDIAVSLGANGEVVLQPSDIDNGSTDNCSFTLSLDRDTFGCSDIGTATVTLTVTDLSGNTDTATATVTILPVPTPTTVSDYQTFCTIDVPTIASIDVDNPATVVWYGSLTDTTPLNPGRLLTNGTYYAVNMYGACSSTGRLAVNVSVNDVVAPTGESIQYLCIENKNTVADLVTDQEVVWYDAMNGGNALSASTPLEHGTSYYAAQNGLQCESIKRLKVSVVIYNCDVVVNNAVSANNDGKNDYLAIDGIEYFKENHIEIFNRWGAKVFETSRYGVNDNYFKGYPNTGAGASDTTILPFGTYYYVLEFVDHNGQSQSKTGYIHLNH